MSEANEPPLPCSPELYLKSAATCPTRRDHESSSCFTLGQWPSANEHCTVIVRLLSWKYPHRLIVSEVVVGILRQKKTNRFREH